MATSSSTLGRCPDCRSPVPDDRVLIEYERGDHPAAFAECPACGDVVRPE